MFCERAFVAAEIQVIRLRSDCSRSATMGLAAGLPTQLLAVVLHVFGLSIVSLFVSH